MATALYPGIAVHESNALDWQSRTCGGAENEMHSEHSEQDKFSAVA